MNEASTKRGLLGSWSLVAGLTTVSRVLGLAREIAFAWFVGAGVVMDAFIVAFRIPSLFRHFFAEGALSQSFVPVYSERMEAGDGAEELRNLLSRVMGTLGAVVALVSLAGVIFAPVFVWLFAPGFALQGGEPYEQAVAMLRRTFPYLFFISIAALLAAALNAHRKFAAAAFTPVLMNISLIAAASLYAMRPQTQGEVLGWGVFAAGLAQMVFLLFFARSTCGPFRLQWGWRDSKVRRILTLMAPVVIGSSAAQVGVVLDTILASFLMSGKHQLAQLFPAPDGIPLGRVRRGLGHGGAAPAVALACRRGTRRVLGIHGLGDPVGAGYFAALRRRFVYPRRAHHGNPVPWRKIQSPGCRNGGCEPQGLCRGAARTDRNQDAGAVVSSPART